jgi:hypothetical protein
MFGLWKKNQSKPTLNVKLGLESLGDRIVPAHLNPGVGEVVLPDAAAHGAHGIETSNHATDNHTKCIKTFTD